MKIGIMGSHGTGKTTLSKRIVSLLKDRELNAAGMGELARLCPYGINKNSTETGQAWMFTSQIYFELEMARRGYDAVVCDRTALDSLMYAYSNGMSHFYDNWILSAIDWMKTYDILFFCRPGPGEIQDDGVRDLDPSYRDRIDKRFEKTLIRYLGLTHAFIVHGNSKNGPIITDEALERYLFTGHND